MGGGGTLSLSLSFLEGVAEGVVLAGGKINPGSWHSLVTPDDGINAQNLWRIFLENLWASVGSRGSGKKDGGGKRVRRGWRVNAVTRRWVLMTNVR